MKTLKLQLPKPLVRQLNRYAKKHGISLEAAAIAAIERNATSKQDQRINVISDRLTQIEQCLSTLINDQPGTTSAQTAISNECEAQAELFLTDDEQQTRRNLAYQIWLEHFKNHPEDLETGRSAHEMAALKASVV